MDWLLLLLLLGSSMPAERKAVSFPDLQASVQVLEIFPYHVWMRTTCVNSEPEFEVAFEELVE